MAALLMLPIAARDIACAAYCRAPGGARFELSTVENALKASWGAPNTPAWPNCPLVALVQQAGSKGYIDGGADIQKRERPDGSPR